MAGKIIDVPLLFTRTSSLPPVSALTLFTAAAIDSEDNTSSVRTVTFGDLERDCEIFDGVRAVAKT